MFKKQMALTLLVLIPVLALWIIKTTTLSSSDIATYQKLIKNQELASSVTSSNTNQERYFVRKDIWFAQDNHSRLHYHILSKRSVLTLTPIHNKFEVVETLEGIQCWMQDRLFSEGPESSPMQQTRYIEAKEGLYRFNTQEFLANKVELSLYQLPGHHLPFESSILVKPFLHGIATNISFLFSGKTPHFQAAQFKAVVSKEP